MVAKRKIEREQRLADEFNEKHPIGTSVVYHPFMDSDGLLMERRKSKATTKSEAFLPDSGIPAVIFLNGVSGYVSLRHVVA